MASPAATPRDLLPGHDDLEMVLRGVADPPERISAGLHVGDRLLQHLAPRLDRGIANPQVFVSAILSWPRALGHAAILKVVVGPQASKVRGLHLFAILQIPIRPVADYAVVKT